jgi:hypothetical protein
MASNKQYLDKNVTFLEIIEILRKNPKVKTAEVHKQFPDYAAGSISAYMSMARKKIFAESSIKVLPVEEVVVAAPAPAKSRTIRRPAKVSTPAPATEVEVVVDTFESRLQWVKESTLARIAEAEKRRADLIDEIEAIEERMRTLKQEVQLVEVMATAPHSAEYLISELSC